MYKANVHNIFLAGVVTGGITNHDYDEDKQFRGIKLWKLNYIK